MQSKDKKGIEKIINIILNIFIVLFGIVLLITIYGNIQTKIFKKSYADFFGYSLFEVQTGSMSDAINAGDWIIVKSSKDYKLNDVVTYKLNNEYITHRIIQSYNDTYITKGDANNTKDDPINKDQIIGKVRHVLTGLGMLRKTIFNPPVVVALIITILLINSAFKKEKNDKQLATNKSIKLKFPKIKKSRKTLKKPIEKIDSKVEKPKETVKIVPKIQEEEVKEILNSEGNNKEEEVLSYIPVDIAEIDDTFLEIAKTEIKEFEKPKEMVKEEELIIEEVSSTKINLELLEGNKAKKGKNIIDKVMIILIEEINELINVFDDDGKTFVNEPTIKNILMSSYIDARYYNYYLADVELTKKISMKVEKSIQFKAESMIKSYKGSDSKYADKVNRFCKIFILISNLEQGKQLITDNKAKIEFYKKEITKFAKISKWNSTKIKTAINEVIKIQRNYVGILEYFYKKIETNMFSLEFNKITSKKDMYGVSLDHNINFSKVYSDYIIDKTYNEGIIAEDKIIVLLTLLSLKIADNMINSLFNKKYILYIPKSLYSKDKKLDKVLRMIADEEAKESITILLTYDELLKYKTVIKKIIKNGYKIAVVFDKEAKIDEKGYANLYFADYIFVDKKVINVVKMLSALPDDLIDKIIYDDITNKIGDFGGE